MIDITESIRMSDSLDYVLGGAKSIARLTGQVVKLTFNGKTRRVNSSTDVKKLYRNWYKVSKARKQRRTRERRRRQLQLTRRAKRLYQELPARIKALVDKDKLFYGKRLTICLWAEALKIRGRFSSLEELQMAWVENEIAIDVMHSGASRSMLGWYVVNLFENEANQKGV